MTAVIPRVLILALLLVAGLSAAAQEPDSTPPSAAPPASSEQQSQNAASSTVQEGQSSPSEEKGKEDEKKKKKGALGRLKDHVKDHFSTGCVGAGTAGGCWGDDKDKKDQQQGQTEGPDKNPPPPRSAEDGDPEFSSSRDTQIDLSPPGQERQNRRKVPPPDEIQELQHYDPHAAEKDIEVGEYYLKSGNLKAALARFRSALYNKPNDAIATFRLAQALEKAGQLAEAREYYEKYLKILPKGEFAADCQKALERLPAPPAESAEAAPTSAPVETPPSKR